MTIEQRKKDHIRVNLEENVQSDLTAGFERYRLIHNALPERNFETFETSVSFLGKTISAPIMISSMTGGTESAERVNRNLAAAAESLRIPFAIGSMRVYIEEKRAETIQNLRSFAPNIPILANVGAVQLNYGFTREDCLRAVEMIEADALIFHFNPLQEIFQKNGNTNFSGLLKKIEKICRDFPCKIIAKEVGSGFSVENVRQLVEAGISMIDIAGAGGTSWVKVEARVEGSEEMTELAEPFGAWGLPTAECLWTLRNAFPELPLIASGGLKNGVDAAKAILLGADCCGFAGALLPEALKGNEEEIRGKLERIILQYKIARFLSSGIEKTNQEKNNERTDYFGNQSNDL